MEDLIHPIAVLEEHSAQSSNHILSLSFKIIPNRWSYLLSTKAPSSSCSDSVNARNHAPNRAPTYRSASSPYRPNWAASRRKVFSSLSASSPSPSRPLNRTIFKPEAFSATKRPLPTSLAPSSSEFANNLDGRLQCKKSVMPHNKQALWIKRNPDGSVLQMDTRPYWLQRVVTIGFHLTSAVQYNWFVNQLDVNNVFFHGFVNNFLFISPLCNVLLGYHYV